MTAWKAARQAAGPCIDLLPWRIRRQQWRRRALALAMVVLPVLAAGLVRAVEVVLHHRAARIDTELARLDQAAAASASQRHEARRLQRENEGVRGQLRTVATWRRQRDLGARLLRVLPGSLPAGVYLTSLEQEMGTVTAEGVASSTAAVSEWMERMARAPAFAPPELLYSAAREAGSPAAPSKWQGVTFRLRFGWREAASRAAQRRSG